MNVSALNSLISLISILGDRKFREFKEFKEFSANKKPSAFLPREFYKNFVRVIISRM